MSSICCANTARTKVAAWLQHQGQSHTSGIATTANLSNLCQTTRTLSSPCGATLFSARPMHLSTSPPFDGRKRSVFDFTQDPEGLKPTQGEAICNNGWVEGIGTSPATGQSAAPNALYSAPALPPMIAGTRLPATFLPDFEIAQCEQLPAPGEDEQSIAPPQQPPPIVSQVQDPSQRLADARSRTQTVSLARNRLSCGVSTGLVGFAAPDASGN